MLSTTETMDLRDGKILSGPLRKSVTNLAIAKPVDNRNVRSWTTSELATGSVRVQQREDGRPKFVFSRYFSPSFPPCLSFFVRQDPL